MSLAPETPNFANGLFLTSANLGTMIGATVGGLFIAESDTSYIICIGFPSLLLSVVFILLRNYKYSPKTNQLDS
ncbi:hypothetical protein [Lederbergia lenta]|uniref:Major facilitator superfamily n=1 Tax=Lederbergia lenta TaxID=1467 RepID=A0A2X4W7F9_LEDLE|nr:hypothetical protein [Lederbergia lenta]MCM3109558.1 hypothetical protein [Lederbergia lenta]MEC2324688.1 hypothetical protein [Lederbergia lenta]SQI58659.1 major facilitator superfamily [Lederbergia lenta]